MKNVNEKLTVPIIAEELNVNPRKLSEMIERKIIYPLCYISKNKKYKELYVNPIDDETIEDID